MTLYLKRPFGKDKSVLKTIANTLVFAPLKRYVSSKRIVYKPTDPFELIATDFDIDLEDLAKRDIVDLAFAAIPDFLPAKKVTYSNFVCRFDLNAKKLRQEHRTVLEIAKLIYDKYKNRMIISHTDEYSADCFIEVRACTDYGTNFKSAEHNMHYLANNLVIAGIPDITQCFFKHDVECDEWVIETEGSNLKLALMHPLIDKKRSFTNNIHEIKEVFGIEAAKKMIVKEINVVLANFDCSIDNRHLVLLSEIMCLNGYIMSITRFGLKKENTGPLTKASFEETKDILKDSARFGYVDDLKGCAAAIMVGKPANIGTGSVEVYLDPKKVMKGKTMEPKLSPETEKLVEMVLKGEAKPHERMSHSSVDFIPSEYAEDFGEDFDE